MSRSLTLIPTLVFAGALFALAGCAAETEPVSVSEAPEVTETESTESESSESEEDSYIVRLTPVANIKGAVNVEVNGLDGRVELPKPSAESAVTDCLHLLPAASGEGETLTLIYSDGVEEACEWP